METQKELSKYKAVFDGYWGETWADHIAYLKRELLRHKNTGMLLCIDYANTIYG